MIIRKDKYEDRKYTIYSFFIGAGVLFLIRLLYLQLWSDELKMAADNNTRRDVTIYPPRGLVYDRNGELMVFNEAVFDLMIVPNQAKEIDISELCNLLEIDSLEYQKRFDKARVYSPRKASIFEKQLSKVQTAFLQEKLFMFPGFYVQARTLRKYPHPTAAHLLGYINEVNNNEMEKDTFYAPGDYIGKSGIEKSYETYLRGRKGIQKMMVDVHNREKGAFHDGIYDVQAENGKNLYTGIDLKLQIYGEELMKNKVGGIVAIEPSTGEIIALVSTPNYDPNVLVGREMSKAYNALVEDPIKPLLNRALNSAYPPGSTFKIVQALIAQQEQVANANTYYSCSNGWSYRGLHVGCHPHPSPSDLATSVEISCNAYYCNVYRSLLDNPKYKNTEAAFNHWRGQVNAMGFGVKYGIDLPYEKTGNIPTSKYYDKYYGRGHWNAITTISLSIGQGEILATPLQLANLACIMANRGYYFTPHVVAAIEHASQKQKLFMEKHFAGVDAQYYQLVVDAMENVVQRGTAQLAKIDSISVCGKTGTAQNPHGENHSVFIAFAPKDNPKIAIAVFIENSGYGGTWAAPIASLMIEQYLKGYVPEKRKYLETRMLEGKLM